MAGTYRPPSGARPCRIAWLAVSQLSPRVEKKDTNESHSGSKKMFPFWKKEAPGNAAASSVFAFESDQILSEEHRDIFRIGAQTQYKINIMLCTQFRQHLHDRFRFSKLRVAQLQESVNEDGADVEVG